MEVIITSNRPMFEGSIASGVALLRRMKNQFYFDTTNPHCYKRLPKLFRGKWFKATFSREMFRFTGIFTKQEIIGLRGKALRKQLHKELDAALDKLLSYAA